ncbi:MAG: alpha/beta fold hydrolase [Chloroflexi bacterium]|nr:alpha/beta fold hydrolase [Chloroflexota bacterium]
MVYPALAMFDPPDYSIIEGTEAAARGFFPRPDWAPPPPGATDFMVAVAEGVQVGCRMFPGDRNGPSLLFFHGNGETACDYNDIAPFYTRMGVNLCVADYRGYGFSGGSPSFPTMLADAHVLFRAFQEVLAANGASGARYVMGRSMGAHSAVELAAHYPGELRGLVLESGAASAGRLVEYLESAGRGAEARELERRHTEKVRAVALPTLMIHGEWDELIPLSRATAFFETLTMAQKRLEVIPGAGHNDLLWVGLEQYMAAIRAFLLEPAQPTP